MCMKSSQLQFEYQILFPRYSNLNWAIQDNKTGLKYVQKHLLALKKTVSPL